MTTEREWLSVLRLAPRWSPKIDSALVVAPHPDDEVLGAGGMIADLRRKNVPVKIVAVTDGESAYPGMSGLGAVRRLEQEKALGRIGLSTTDITRLQLPDGDVSSHEDRLAGELEQLLTPAALVVAPWVLDFHPDHEACGRAAVRAALACGNRLASYLFWTWHRRPPDTVLSACPKRFNLDRELRAAKRSALAFYRSQLEREGGEPILPESLLAPARRAFETFIINGES